MATAEMLEAAGDIKLPSNLPTSSLTSSMTSTSSQAGMAILTIHQYRDAAVTALRAQAEVLSNNQVTRSPEVSAEDFNSASDNLYTSMQQLYTSLQQLHTSLQQLRTAARTLQQCSTDSGLPEVMMMTMMIMMMIIVMIM